MINRRTFLKIAPAATAAILFNSEGTVMPINTVMSGSGKNLSQNIIDALNAADNPSGSNPFLTDTDVPLSQNILDALNGANAPAAGNVFATMADVGGGGGDPVGRIVYQSGTVDLNSYIPLDGRVVNRVTYPALSATVRNEQFGLPWSERAMPSSGNWNAICASDTQFLAMKYGSNICATSPDGIVWTEHTLPVSGNWIGVAWSGTVFCAVDNGSDVVLTSTNGIVWNQHTMPSSALWYDIVWNGTVFCAIANTSDKSATSPDGQTWTPGTLPSSTTWFSVAWNGTIFCAIANSSTAAATSTDGIVWTARTLPASLSWRRIVSDGKKFCVVSSTQSGGMWVATSYNGKNWEQNVGINTYLDSVVWNGKYFVCLAEGGYFGISLDGKNWEPVAVPLSSYNSNQNMIASLNGHLCMVYNGAMCQISGYSDTQILIPTTPDYEVFAGYVKAV